MPVTWKEWGMKNVKGLETVAIEKMPRREQCLSLHGLNKGIDNHRYCGTCNLLAMLNGGCESDRSSGKCVAVITKVIIGVVNAIFCQQILLFGVDSIIIRYQVTAERMFCFCQHNILMNFLQPIP